MSVFLVCAASLVAALLVLTALAFREEHLVVLYWPRVALVVLEWQGGTRYQQLSPVLVPLALARFAARGLSLAPAAARREVSRIVDRLALPVSSKA